MKTVKIVITAAIVAAMLAASGCSAANSESALLENDNNNVQTVTRGSVENKADNTTEASYKTGQYDFPDYYGGDYLDENKCRHILVVGDEGTDEYNANMELCREYLKVGEDETVFFHPADYPLSKLCEISDAITPVMIKYRVVVCGVDYVRDDYGNIITPRREACVVEFGEEDNTEALLEYLSQNVEGFEADCVSFHYNVSSEFDPGIKVYSPYTPPGSHFDYAKLWREQNGLS